MELDPNQVPFGTKRNLKAQNLLPKSGQKPIFSLIKMEGCGWTVMTNRKSNKVSRDHSIMVFVAFQRNVCKRSSLTIVVVWEPCALVDSFIGHCMGSQEAEQHKDLQDKASSRSSLIGSITSSLIQWSLPTK